MEHKKESEMKPLPDAHEHVEFTTAERRPAYTPRDLAEEDLQTEPREYHLMDLGTRTDLKVWLCRLVAVAEDPQYSRKELQAAIIFLAGRMQEKLQDAPLRIVYASTR